MQLGIFAKTFTGTAPGPVLHAVASAGYSATQYNMACSGLAAMPERIEPALAGAVRAAAAAAGVRIVAVSATYNMIHPDPAVRERGLRRLAVIAAAASSLSTRLITLCTGTCDPLDQWRAHPDNDTPQAWGDLHVAMQAALRIAEQYDVELGIEPELANVVSSPAKALQLIEEIGSERLRVVLDPANLFETATLSQQREIVSAAIDRLADRIAMAHAKDRTASGDFTEAGRGVLDYPFYLACLAQAGFDGPLVTHGLPAENAAAVARFLHRSLEAAGIAVGG